MAQNRDLTGISTSDIRAELSSRAAHQSDTPLKSISTEQLVKKLLADEKVIYEVDDRKDYYEFSPNIRNMADGVAALFREAAIVDNGDGTSTLQTQPFGPAFGLCKQERFFNQPIGAFLLWISRW